MIVVQQLAKRFDAVAALRDVSFTAKDGRITGLLGANGAGKSTTLRIISTVMRCDSGRTAIDGDDILRDPFATRRRLGVLPHASGLYTNLTARENIHYFGALHGLERSLIEARIAEWVNRLDMADVIDRRTKGFSHGQKLKVSLVRALIHAPRNIILDEPTSGLDISATRALREVIRALRDAGHCVLLSSHIMQEVSALCDDIVIIANGTVVASGTPDEIRALTARADLEEAFMQLSHGESAA